MSLKGNRYTDDDVKVVMRQTNRWLQDLHNTSVEQVVDFDLFAVFIMQEMDDELHIRKLVNMLIVTFFDTGKPQTTRQNQLVQAALVVRKKIEKYDLEIKTNPSYPKPYCLRYPTLQDVRARSAHLESRCMVLDDEQMVILLDENRICVGIGLPPFPTSQGNPVHISHETRALECLRDMVAKPVCKLDVGQLPPFFVAQTLEGSPQTPFPLDDKNKGNFRTW
ncbi:uncharacterized protein PGTG_11897 [Puccinia graminis f. sp. tritici CRL 75-36-700-3]|uniref:Uncharacterized protein n=1 Tax=Puccinia graminis f. sp. tritici (strain CRL 75-36-700-3 / race SCCL) TaxID=418459 RepID=E3KML6_PUCGT|nr:uncharacterized protein PGTG_11897 [Puccinia graminis f. sp. tritici CRL 75-36-700-3]EFP85541.2 hypothetical protein PGTG_11897 [Puccinia graminis f. sp. tritici CRL 75-36-700-3]